MRHVTYAPTSAESMITHVKNKLEEEYNIYDIKYEEGAQKIPIDMMSPVRKQFQVKNHSVFYYVSFFLNQRFEELKNQYGPLLDDSEYNKAQKVIEDCFVQGGFSGFDYTYYDTLMEFASMTINRAKSFEEKLCA